MLLLHLRSCGTLVWAGRAALSYPLSFPILLAVALTGWRRPWCNILPLSCCPPAPLTAGSELWGGRAEPGHGTPPLLSLCATHVSRNRFSSPCPPRWQQTPAGPDGFL